MNREPEQLRITPRLVLSAFLLGGFVFAAMIAFFAACGMLVSVTAGGEDLDQSSALAHELDHLVNVAAQEWGFAGLRPHAAVGDLPPGVMAATQRYSAGECFIVFATDAAWWPAEARWETALHEVGHCRWALYAVPGGLSEHNPDEASVMFAEYRPGGRILASDRAAVRPERVMLAGVSR